jgi:uncharacterized protein (DUF2252 family)
VEDRAAKGRAARTGVPRSSHSTLELDAARDPIAVLETQNASRVAELVPIRYGRMLVSPLAFFRGAAAVMTNDLRMLPNVGLRAQLSGDAHLLNFGGFASAERDLLFDVNDFDETLPGPFEWDVKRLAASFEIAARDRDFKNTDRSAVVLGVVRAYREAIRRFATMGDLDVWYAHLDAQSIIDNLRAGHDTQLAKRLGRSADKARSNDGRRELAKLTRVVDGELRIISEPPLIVPLSELAPDDTESSLRAMFRGYGRSLSPDRRVLLDRFRPIDVARKVVGVGSVGTRCWILLLLGRDEHDPLFLQIKEANASVLEAVLGPAGHTTHGRRVVEGQRLMQASGDIFLGWAHAEHALDGGKRDFYVRQLRDWKMSLDVATILPGALADYGAACGSTLARAHARTGDRIAIAAYLGASDTFDRAVAKYAAAYADLNERDHRALVRAVADGRVTAREGV